MKNKRIIRPENIHKLYAGSTELSPFHCFYANKKTVLRICAGRFFPHYNGENVTDAYWSLRRNAALFDVPERPIEISGPDSSYNVCTMVSNAQYNSKYFRKYPKKPPQIIP